jgi:hypothetical protein
MLGLLLFGLGTGFNRGWLQLRWGLMLRDLGMPFACDPNEPTKCYPSGSPLLENRQSR